MASVLVFEEKGDVVSWIAKMKAKLVSKGYKSHLLNSNRPQDGAERVNWDLNAEKALSAIQLHLHPDIVIHFENLVTPQTLLEGIRNFYLPDAAQKVERLEKEFMELIYDGIDPVSWITDVRGKIARLISLTSVQYSTIRWSEIGVYHHRPQHLQARLQYSTV